MSASLSSFEIDDEDCNGETEDEDDDGENEDDLTLSEEDSENERQDDFSEDRFDRCNHCYFESSVSYLHRLLPFTWVFSQTRWPPLFAPYQVVNLNMQSEIKVPPWRASVGQLFTDICDTCERNPDFGHLLLLDPMVITHFINWYSLLNTLILL